MKIARRIVAIMLASLMTFALLAGCGEQAPAADDVVQEVVSAADTVSEADVAQDAVSEADAVVEEVASSGSADSDVVEEVRLYMIDSYGWNTFESAESAVIPASGGTFTLSVTADEMNFMRIASVYLKDYSCRLGSTSKSQFASATITLDKVTFNGTELSLTNNGAEEAIGSNGVFDYCFINQWYTPGLKVSNCVIPEGQGSFMFDGVEYLDGRNTMEVTFTVAPIASDKILTVEETLRQLQGLTLSSTSISLAPGDTSALVCNTNPVVCADYIYNFDSKVVWSSSDPSIVTVDNTGAIAAVGEGTATITASYEGYTASCEVISSARPTAIVKLYAYYNWATIEGSEVVIDTTSGGQSFSASVGYEPQWWGGFHTLYFKDVNSYDTNGGTLTEIPNTVITIDSVTYNGVDLALKNNENIVVGDQFNVEILNIWALENNLIVDEQITTTDNAYITFKDSEGNSLGEGWPSNEVIVDFTVNTVSE